MRSKIKILSLCGIIAFPLIGVSILSSCSKQQPTNHKLNTIDEIKSLNDVLFFKLSSFTNFEKIADSLEENVNVSGTVFNLLKCLKEKFSITLSPTIYNGNDLIYLVCPTGKLTKSTIPQSDEKWVELQNEVTLFKSKMESVENIETLDFYKNSNFISLMNSLSDYSSKKIKSDFTFLEGFDSNKLVSYFNDLLEGLDFEDVSGVNGPFPINDDTTLTQLHSFLLYNNETASSAKLLNISLNDEKKEQFTQFTLELNDFLNLIKNNKNAYEQIYDNSIFENLSTLSLNQLSNNDRNSIATSVVNNVKNINDNSTITIETIWENFKTLAFNGPNGFLYVKRAITPTSKWVDLQNSLLSFVEEAYAITIKWLTTGYSIPYFISGNIANFFFSLDDKINTNVIASKVITAFNNLVSNDNKISLNSTFQQVFIDSINPETGPLIKAESLPENMDKWMLLSSAICKFMVFQYLSSIKKKTGYNSEKKIDEATYSIPASKSNFLSQMIDLFGTENPVITGDTTFAELETALSTTGALYVYPGGADNFIEWYSLPHYSYFFVATITSF
ncbi:MAG: hypothetical protein LBB39_03995 [Mycoplasmataceae bacterium]|nr:hypothetical protein [Mycoplasmataceae bacterium]